VARDDDVVTARQLPSNTSGVGQPVGPGFAWLILGGSHMAQTKCAHPPCTCKVKENGRYGTYCSEYCKQAGENVVEIFCECHHAGCGAAHP
jgi:hypothetical protein